MPSAQPRISTVVEKPVYEAVARLARREGVSLSQKARDLILEALELVEDTGLESLAERRRREKGKPLSHQEMKRRLRLA